MLRLVFAVQESEKDAPDIAAKLSVAVVCVCGRVEEENQVLNVCIHEADVVQNVPYKNLEPEALVVIRSNQRLRHREVAVEN